MSATAVPPFGAASRRSPVYARNVMAAASQPAAVDAGLGVLDNGGTAADAAVAMAAVLAVIEPCSTGLGGDAFALYYDAEKREVTGINGSGRSPQALTPELLQERTGGNLPERHALTATVPGACSAWCALMERFGVLSLSDVLSPARELAGDGFMVGPVTASLWQSGEDVLRAAGGEELLYDGHGPHPGQLVKNTGMARVLDILSRAGGIRVACDAFYGGEVGEDIVRAVKERGGVLSREDLARHTCNLAEPVETVYRGKRIFECAPNGQGIAALMALNILSSLDDGTFGVMQDERLHAQIEAMRLAFADARQYVADPDYAPAPVQGMLDMGYAKSRAALVDSARRSRVEFGTPPSSSDTVYFCVVDGDGNACSMVNSCYMTFGTGIVPQNTGFAVQNRGYNFSLDPRHPNCLAPGKRTYHTIIPGMALNPDGSLWGPFGVMGGFMQPQGHVQVLSALLDDALDPQAALDRLRFCVGEDASGAYVALEEGMPQNVVRALEAKGHPVRMVTGYDRGLFGRGQVILRDAETGWLTAGSDPRADGCAFGF